MKRLVNLLAVFSYLTIVGCGSITVYNEEKVPVNVCESQFKFGDHLPFEAYLSGVAVYTTPGIGGSTVTPFSEGEYLKPTKVFDSYLEAGSPDTPILFDVNSSTRFILDLPKQSKAYLLHLVCYKVKYGAEPVLAGPEEYTDNVFTVVPNYISSERETVEPQVPVMPELLPAPLPEPLPEQVTAEKEG